MAGFSTSLVREKIVFTEDENSLEDEQDNLRVVRSNRVFLKLTSGGATEKIVVRAQTMHLTLRYASRILASYYKKGLFSGREVPFNWQLNWESVQSNYDKEYYPEAWAAVYVDGSAVFRTNSSAYVDIIEKCALLNADNYDATIDLTESALRQVGKSMQIHHSSNIAAVMTDEHGATKCGIMHRANGKDLTFTFIAEGKNEENRVTQTMGIAAAYIEALNLRYIVKALHDLNRGGEIEKISPEARKLRAAKVRLTALNKGISDFEGSYAVKYNPEKPEIFLH